LLGFEDGPADFSFPIPAEATARAGALLDRHHAANKKIAVLAPGTIWETKTWRGEGFAEVARHFLQSGFAVTLIGAARERAACDKVESLAPGVINLAGETTLTELAALIRRSSISVTNDSGPMHMAVALGRPVVSIFGPTEPVWIGPYGRSDAVLQAKLACSPCYLRQLSRCDFSHRCMREISAAAVIERVESVLRTQDAADAPARAPAHG
jgi:lipopolysaccharide heptosyltransferase II